MTRRRATLGGSVMLVLLTAFAPFAATSAAKPKKKKHAALTLLHVRVASGNANNPTYTDVASGATVQTCPDTSTKINNPVFYLSPAYSYKHALVGGKYTSKWSGPSFKTPAARTNRWRTKSGTEGYNFTLNPDPQGRTVGQGFLPGTYTEKVIERKKVIGKSSITVVLAPGCQA